MIKAVLFDYGGVLSSGGKSVKRVYSKLLNIPEQQIEIEDINAEFRRGDLSAEDFFVKLSERYGKPVTAQEFLKYSDIFSKNQAVYDMAAQLRQHGIVTGILSNMYELTAKILRQDGYYEGFDPVILSCQEGLAKPDPQFYKMAVERLACQPNEVLFIDDQDKCFPPAVELGMHVIKAKSERQIVADAKALILKENGLKL